MDSQVWEWCALRRVSFGTVWVSKPGVVVDGGEAVPDQLLEPMAMLVVTGLVGVFAGERGIGMRLQLSYRGERRLATLADQYRRKHGEPHREAEVDLSALLRRELLNAAESDRHLRSEFAPGEVTEHDPHRITEVDRENTAWLAGVVAVWGWPTENRVGVGGAHAAWLLAQHADPAHRAAWLPKLRAAVSAGQASARDLAFLDDRVRVDQHRPQMHGTQRFVAGQVERLFPLADPRQVNEYRRERGLKPLSTRDIETAAWPDVDGATGTSESS